MSTHGYAQTTEDAELDPVSIFNDVCYSKIPSIEAIEGLAIRFAWEPIRSKNMSLFSNLESPDLIKGWDMKLDERVFRVGLVQGKPNDSFNSQYPDFAAGTYTSCTLIMDGQDDAATTHKQMDLLIGKDPISREVPNEELITTTWHGGNEAFKVFVFYQSDSTGSANVITVTLLEK